MKPPAEDLERRRPVWGALSELFLDTKLDDVAYQSLAGILAQSGYSDAELQAILAGEVHPVCIPNLLSMCGEWAGFEPAELERRILVNERRPVRKWFMSRYGRSMVRDAWQKLMPLVQEQRQADRRGNADGAE
jgi:hypothetical protein